jgi:hypothetical protein
MRVAHREEVAFAFAFEPEPEPAGLFPPGMDVIPFIVTVFSPA